MAKSLRAAVALTFFHGTEKVEIAQGAPVNTKIKGVDKTKLERWQKIGSVVEAEDFSPPQAPSGPTAAELTAAQNEAAKMKAERDAFEARALKAEGVLEVLKADHAEAVTAAEKSVDDQLAEAAKADADQSDDDGQSGAAKAKAAKAKGE